MLKDPDPDHEVLVDRRGPVLWVTFNRPQARNAMSWNMYDRLLEICDEVNGDGSIKAMVLTGAGGMAFVAGTDIGQFRAFKTEQDAIDYETRGNHVMNTLEAVRVPTIAAIAGACTGGGAAIAASCDLRIGSPSARYGFPIAKTLGNCLSIQNYARLFALLGPAKVKDIIFTARLMDSREMLECGLLSEVTPDEESLLPRAQELAEQVSSHAPLTLKATKDALRRIRDQLIPPDGDESVIAAVYMSRDFREGVDAFMSKRKPVWRGE